MHQGLDLRWALLEGLDFFRGSFNQAFSSSFGCLFAYLGFFYFLGLLVLACT